MFLGDYARVACLCETNLFGEEFRMIIRTLGLVATILVVVSLMDHFGVIQITSSPLKHLADALIQLGEAASSRIQSF